MNELVTIIIPVYKVEHCISKCIDSVISQTYSNWELILIDDGSPDASGTICDQYAEKDTRIKVLHVDNGGPSKARNVGLDVATGVYVCFIDSDDWVCSNYLQNFHLDESDGIDLVIQGLEYYDQRDGHFFSPWSFKECVLKKDDFLFAIKNNTEFVFKSAFSIKVFFVSSSKNLSIGPLNVPSSSNVM